MKRMLDVAIAMCGFVVLAIPLILIGSAVKLTSSGSVVYWSQRVGRSNRLFWMPKFRTMRVNTPQLATHLLQSADSWMTPIGRFLRSTSLDELPQLWSILIGDMSLVGPRPALFNQNDLIQLRTRVGVSNLVPGLTGWAQINGRDELSIPDKVELDAYYLQHQSLLLDLRIMILTVFKVLRREGIVQAGEKSDNRATTDGMKRTAA